VPKTGEENNFWGDKYKALTLRWSNGSMWRVVTLLLSLLLFPLEDLSLVCLGTR